MIDDVVLKWFERPDEVRVFTKGRLEIIRIGGVTLGRASYEPGWRWSMHVGPTVGAERCTVEHVGMAGVRPVAPTVLVGQGTFEGAVGSARRRVHALATPVGAAVIRWPRRFGWSDDEFCVFSVEGVPFVIIEPFGDNDCYRAVFSRLKKSSVLRKRRSLVP
jgi:hypothetical protein